MSDYRTEVERMLKAAQKRLARARKAKQFKADDSIIVEIISDRVSELLTGMTAKEPLDDRAYLSAHGEIRGLKYILSMLDSFEAEISSAESEVKSTSEQLKQLDEQK